MDSRNDSFFGMNLSYYQKYINVGNGRIMRILLGVFMASMLTISSGCNLKQPKHSSKYGGTLRWGEWNNSKVINPFYTQRGVYNSIFNLIFDNLIGLDKEGNIVGNIARSWKISSDQKVYTFYLREGILFHDGVELSAYDVKFTYDVIRNPENKAIRYKSIQIIDDIVVLDKYTIQLKLKKRSIPFLYSLVSFSIVPKHLFENKALKEVSFADCMVGTGAFIYETTKPDGTIILKRNEDYYLGRAYLERIMFKLYPSQKETYSALLRKEIDCMFFINKEQKRYLEKDDYFEVYSYPAECYTSFFYIIHDCSPLLTDKRIRKAISYAIDRKELISLVEKGNGVEARSLLRGDILNQAISESSSFNISKALQLLKKSGLERTERGWMKDGKMLEIKIAYNSNIPTFLTIVKILRQQLSQIGIHLKTYSYEKESSLNKELFEKEKINSLLLYLSGQDRDPYFALQFLSSEYRAAMKYWNYNNLEINKLFRDGISDANVQTRSKTYQHINRIVVDEKLITFLYYPYVSHVVRRHFKGCGAFFNENYSYHFIKDWFVMEGELEE